jgi:hypothetical protein
LIAGHRFIACPEGIDCAFLSRLGNVGKVAHPSAFTQKNIERRIDDSEPVYKASFRTTEEEYKIFIAQEETALHHALIREK